MVATLGTALACTTEPSQAASHLVTRDPGDWQQERAVSQAQWQVGSGEQCLSEDQSIFALSENLFTGQDLLPRTPVCWKAGEMTPLGTYRWEREEGDGKDREAGGNRLPNPGLGDLVAVTDGGDCDL